MNARTMIVVSDTGLKPYRDQGSIDAGMGMKNPSRAPRPFSCMELWAGNEKAHRSFDVAGLEADVITVSCGARRGGDLAALFSCSDNIARVVLADCVGHGYVASGLARHIHRLLDKFQDIRDTGGFLGALNNDFTLNVEEADGPLRMTTAVTAAFDSARGEFNFAYAGHPRMLLRRAQDTRFYEIGKGMESFPLGFSAGARYLEGSIHLNEGDMFLAFSDGATEVESPDGVQLTEQGFAEFAAETLAKFTEPLSLHDFSKALLDGICEYHGGANLEDDVTLLNLRRSL